MNLATQKELGAYYTPNEVVHSLVSWVVKSPSCRMIDPACGDGRFLVAHNNSVGVEQSPEAAKLVHERAPGCLLHEGDFFSWATSTEERFDCAAGNPPFIRYQRFSGEVRQTAQALCKKNGADFSGLASSWAPFLVAAATLLRPGGRMAFVVPAEIGHASYSRPLLRYLLNNFRHVQIIAIREKVFPTLSEDCWLLYCNGYGSRSTNIYVSPLERFKFASSPPSEKSAVVVTTKDLEAWNWRIRPFLMSGNARDSYRQLCASTIRLGDVAKVGIGYVTGANAFFHLTPSEARRLRISPENLVPAVRNGKSLHDSMITKETIDTWRKEDAEYLLLRLQRNEELSDSVLRYLDSEAGIRARASYKCRSRKPWYSVPEVVPPDAFLSYMSSDSPKLVVNRAGCVGTNSVHVVRLTSTSVTPEDLLNMWSSVLTSLSCELEGHPLGGGMLKIEPREASRVALKTANIPKCSEIALKEGLQSMRHWRNSRIQ